MERISTTSEAVWFERKLENSAANMAVPPVKTVIQNEKKTTWRNNQQKIGLTSREENGKSSIPMQNSR